MEQKIIHAFFALTKIFEFLFDIRKIKLNQRIHIEHILLFVLLLVLFVFVQTSSSVLETNIHLVEELVGTYTTKDRERTPREAREIVKNLQYLFCFSSIIFYFCMTMSGRYNEYIGSKAKKDNLFLLHPQIPVIMVAILGMGFCVQLGMYDPLYSRLEGNGFSQFSFQFSLSDWKNPLIFPSLCMLASPLFFIFSQGIRFWGKSKKSDFSIFRQKEGFWGSSNSSLRAIFVLLLFAFVFLIVIGAGGSAFSSGITVLEPLKQAILVAIVLIFVHHRRNVKFEHIPTLKPRQDYLVLGVIAMMSILIGLADDIGALIIITYSMVLVFSLWYQRNRGVSARRVYALIIGSALFVIPLMKYIPMGYLDERRRFREWRMGDGIFLHSGIGKNFLPGTASSPDFARTEWSLASANFTGRGTSLFVDANGGDPFAAYLAYGHNDRVIVTMAETFGLLGVLVCLLLYSMLTLSLLATFAQTFKGFNKWTSGIALACASIIFGQVYVHTGGNLGLLPFTGIVLPFISHGTTANLCLISLVMFCSMRSYSILYKNVGLDEDNENKFYFRIISGCVFLFLSLLSIQITYKLLIESPQRATYVRYGVQSDLSMKVTYNPRLYVLSDLLDAQARVEDQSGIEIRTEDGFQFSHLNNKDRTFLSFLDDNKDIERGFLTKEVSTYVETKCSLHGLDYALFGGAFVEDDVRRIENFQTINQRNNIHPKLKGKECIIPEPPIVGSFSKDLGRGTIDGKICIIGSTPYENTKEHLISYYDAEGKHTNPEKTEAAGCSVRELFDVGSSKKGTVIHYDPGEFFNDSCFIETTDSKYTDKSVKKQMDKSTHIIERHIEWNGDECTVHTTYVGCKVEGVVYGPMDEQNIEAKIASRSLFFNYYVGKNLEKKSIDQKLSQKDTECSIQNYSIGALVQTKKNGQDVTIFKEKKMKKLVSPNFDLGTFARLSVDEQLVIKEDKEKEIREQTITLQLHAKLQNKVQSILEKEIKRLEENGIKVPSIQSLIFHTESGDILAQNQITRPRFDLQALHREKKYEKLFRLDRGEYGFGRNLHKSYMLPASTFKIFHAMAAVLDQKSDFTTQCRGKSKRGKKYKPKNVLWREGINCNGRHGKVSLVKAIQKSCNHYFMDLAFINKTYPESLTSLCEKVPFGRYDSCNVSSSTWESSIQKTGRGAGQDSFGQGKILFNMYQLAGLLQALSNNQEPELCTNLTKSDEEPCFNEKIPLLEIPTTDIFQEIFEGMEQKNKSFTSKKIRVYGKTGTGQDPLHQTNLKTKVKDPSVIQGTKQKDGSCSLQKGSIGNPCWVRDYEKPYGVTKDEDHSIFFALVEDTKAKKYQTGTQRVGIVIRIPRGGKSTNAKNMANQIILDAILPLGLVPTIDE